MKEHNINLKSVTDLTDLETLGIYAYIQIIMQHETSVLPIIIDKIKEQFNVKEKFILDKIRELEKVGLLHVARKIED